MNEEPRRPTPRPKMFMIVSDGGAYVVGSRAEAFALQTTCGTCGERVPAPLVWRDVPGDAFICCGCMLIEELTKAAAPKKVSE